MKAIIATDIFGETLTSRVLLEDLVPLFSSFRIVSPYRDREHSFVDEKRAYQSFIKECGHAAYYKKLCQEIGSVTQPVYLIGFSAGASAIWQSLGRHEFSHVTGFTGFYPSQIRNHLDLTPCCKSRIVFASVEANFEVNSAAQVLQGKTGVLCEVSEFRHGFMNALSGNYSRDALQKYLMLLKDDIKQSSNYVAGITHT